MLEYQMKENKLKRKILKYERTFDHPPKEVFFQLCPSRELDWIPGWDCELLYTSTGYVESDCIFTTPESNSLGPGLWIFTRYEPDQKLELVRIIDNSVVIHFRIELVDNNDGTSTGTWNLTFTAINEAGNVILESISDESPELNMALDGLEYFLDTGELMTV